MIVSIPVTPYVFRYLKKEYGHTPYPIHIDKKNPLRVALNQLELRIEPSQHFGRIPYTIEIDLGEDEGLVKLYQRNESALRAGYFFEREFVMAMRHWVKAQQAQAERHALVVDTGRSQTLQDFLTYYEIPPEEYSWESAYRRLTRENFADEAYLRTKLFVKYKFCSSDNQAFRLCRLWHRKGGPVLTFACYSEQQQDIVNKYHRIPAELVELGDWYSYAQTARTLIDRLLLQGYIVDAKGCHKATA